MTRKKRKAKKFRSKKKKSIHPISIIATLFIAIGFLSSAWQLFELRLEVDQKIAILNKEKETLLQEEKLLNEEILRLNTPSYIEQLAREQLGLVRKGEIRIAPKQGE
ncbi:MAG: septum formation initiator family protein [Desulfitobacterium sp.]|nr:septum formation initiator family protein [Desulfitobacterium sp.]